MEIHPEIEIKDLALYLPREKTLIISDVHIGFEESLHKKGILVPKFYFSLLKERISKILTLPIEKIIINGDLKHEFGSINEQEWREILQFFDLFKEKEIILIKGNHDMILHPIAQKRKILLKEDYSIGDVHVSHGDALPKKEVKEKAIIIGHEHPAVSLKENRKIKKYKCFLKGKWKKKVLIVMPSFHLLKEGTNILERRFLSPFLKDIDDFEVFIIGDKVYSFGKVKNLELS